MKTAETKTSSVAQQVQQKEQPGQTPFFNKEGGQGDHGHAPPPPFFNGGNGGGFFQRKEVPGRPAPVQTKLTVGQPGDKYEQEADQVADKVVQRLAIEKPAPANDCGNNSVVQRKCEACEKEEKDAQPVQKMSEQISRKPIFESNAPEDTIQRKCASCGKEMEDKTPGVQADSEGSTGADSGGLSSVESGLSASKGGGSPLPANTRSSMESAMGADFSGVRVHTDSSAVQMSKDLGAHAFTHGSDIYFNSGKYDTGSSGGQRLLAHELTHTVQQGGASSKDKADREAKEGVKGRSEVYKSQLIQQKKSQSNQPDINTLDPNVPNDPFFIPTERRDGKSKGEFEQDNKNEVEEQLRAETDQASSEVPVEAKIEEGKPTVLLPVDEESPADKKIELQGNSEQTPADNQQSEAKGKPKPKKKKAIKSVKEPSREREDDGEMILANPTTSLPVIESDENFRSIQSLGDQEPSESDLAEHRKDQRSDEEKIAEQNQITSQFETYHQVVRSSIQQKISQESDKTRQQEQSVSNAIRQDTINKTASIVAYILNQKVALQSAYQQSQTLLLESKGVDFVRIEAVRLSKIDLLRAEMEIRRSEFNAFVDEQTSMPTVNANNEADRADRELEAAAEEALAQGENVAMQHPGSDDGNPDAREAVREIASETAADMRSSKETIREDLVNLAAEFNGGFEEYRTDIMNHIGSTEEQILEGIDDAIENFREIIEDSYNSVSESLTVKEQDDLNRLDELQTIQLEALHENERVGLESVKQTTNYTVEEIQRVGQYSLELIDNLGNNTTQLFAQDGNIPIISAVRELQQSSIAQLQELEQEGLAQLDSIANQGSITIDNTQEVNKEASSSICTTASQQSTEVLSVSATQREEVLTNLHSTLDTSFTSLEESIDQMRTEALAGIDQAIEERRNNILQANEEFLAELISQNDENIQTAKQPLTDPLVSRLWSAADRATASWWEGALAAIGDLLVMLIILVAFAALLVFLGAFSTITGALLVIGAVLLAGIFIFSLINRLMEGHGWSSIPLAIADTLGITMIYQGVFNRDIATGEDLRMNTFDRWYSGTSGTVQFILFLSPLKSRIPIVRNIRLPRFLGGTPTGEGTPAPGPIARAIRWIERVGRNNRTRMNRGVEPESQPIGDRFIEWVESRWPFRNRQNEEGDPTSPNRGRRPNSPEQPVLDENGQLTEYGRWYYEKPGNYRNRTDLEQRVWDEALGEDGVARGPNGEELSPNNWKIEPKPGNELPQIQQRAAENGLSRGQFLDEFNDPNNYRATVRDPLVQFSGRRPAMPDQAVIDPQTGELTPYGRWYYERPSGYRDGFRDEVWQNAEQSSEGGVVRDPITLEPMNPIEPWEMGHRYGFEFSKHKVSAARRGISREQFIDEHNTASHYRPELPESNRSHAGEAPEGIYYGP